MLASVLTAERCSTMAESLRALAAGYRPISPAIEEIELKNPTDADATIWTAWQQLQTYKADLPGLFSMNTVMIVSDGLDARLGTLTAGREWFKPWRTIGGEELADKHPPQLQVLLQGVCDQRRFLDVVRDFIVFEDDGGGRLDKKIAGYHQFHAVQAAVDETLRAAALQQAASRPADAGRRPGGQPGDRRIGVVWHTQGSGKSLTMAFYAGRIIRETAMSNPTVVVLTDRNDLYDQLFSTFSRCAEVLRQPPVQAQTRADLRQLLDTASGGVVFTTIQKFFPEQKGVRHPVLSDRRNIVVIADEAHRSQFDFIDGFAAHMRDALPNASFIGFTGFTGTPIEKQDANTRAVFGDHISVYDIQRSVQDKATVPIYYESRLARLALDDRQKPHIDGDFEEAAEGEEVERKEKLKTKWAQLEAVVGAAGRIRQVAADIVEHYETRLDAMDGKAMVVCMSRRICVDLHNELVRLRPGWQHPDDDKGAIKVVMTGSASDPLDWQRHIRNKPRREALANRFRDPADPLRMVLVRDMWLTGFDAPSLHTMYVDKPNAGPRADAGHRQGQPGVPRQARGLVVDYLGLAHELKKALATYTESGGRGETALDQAEAVAVMQEKHEICRGLFWGHRSPHRPQMGQRRRSTRSAAVCSGASTGRHGPGATPRHASACSPRRWSTSWPRRTARIAAQLPCASCPRHSRWPCPIRPLCPSGTTWPSSRLWPRRCPSPPPARPAPKRTSTMPSVRSSPGPSPLKACLTSSRRPAWTSPTSRCCRRSSWPKCGTCPSATWPWRRCAGCCRAR